MTAQSVRASGPRALLRRAWSSSRPLTFVGATMLLVLAHGGVGAVEIVGRVLPLLVEGRRVVAVDLRAHGLAARIVELAEAARALVSGYLVGERRRDV